MRTAVEIEDFEPPAGSGNFLAYVGDLAEPLQQETCKGLVGPR